MTKYKDKKKHQWLNLLECMQTMTKLVRNSSFVPITTMTSLVKNVAVTTAGEFLHIIMYVLCFK